MKHIFCILISSLIFSSSFAQPKDIKISHYLFPEFTQGVILLRSGEKYNTLLNYNSLTEEMIFEKKGKKLAIAMNEIPKVDTIFIKDRKFVTLFNKFVEFVYSSEWELYAEYKCKIEEPGKPVGYGGTSHTSATTSISRLTNDGVVYELKLPDEYKTNPYTIYWLKKNGELNSFINIRQLKILYKDKKDLVKEYLKTNPVKYHDQESIIELIKYLELN